MAIQKFLKSWTELIQIATRLDDNFRKKSQEKGDQYKYNNFQQSKSRKHPDEMNWEINTAFRKRKKGFQKKA
jgi:hypothetical protein